MAQGGLFAAEPLVIVDDEHGRFAYEPGLVAPGEAEAWFASLFAGVPWEAQRRAMYGRQVDVPRLVRHYALDAPDLPPVLGEAGREVIAHTGVPFTSVGLNLYRDGRDSVAPHNDHLEELAEGAPIALLSLGATRRMSLREREAPKRAFDIDMEPGSLLTMSYATQFHYDHGIPKTRAQVGPRISLAFRVRPHGEAGGRRYVSRKPGVL
ncbi:alpha-ketoglutarate-dependent dioxygenase AlkB family protein [Luteibacter yeojuensis]|uniref:Alpha-ketoglutarate-dependent dioxygenase AlkB n=1 Tax=Luteibacter yeojuensis TaxID=345309 RepID=A0A7X5TPL4_9GAMM|nr:alpha-ketoglutarate-dependent dioxygenase AlkB [Luteibacter yeojuensis]NID14898.1 alpha-ketoglutarate-dependent dioxygenase AlkB [Luteibacter yeojuensis]